MFRMRMMIKNMEDTAHMCLSVTNNNKYEWECVNTKQNNFLNFKIPLLWHSVAMLYLHEIKNRINVLLIEVLDCIDGNKCWIE